MKVGLVLGGGGARCLAHIGVYRALEEAQIRVDGVAACSTGALVGALIASGLESAEVKDVFDQNVLTLLSFGEKGGLLDQEKIAELLQPHLPPTFADLDLPFAAVATDIQAGKLVTLNRGDLIPAVLASNAFPGVFGAVSIEGRSLIDGGVLNNVPVDAVTTLTHAPVVAVDVSPSRSRTLELEQDRGLLSRVRGQFTLPVDMLRKAYVISQSFIIDMRLSMHPPDLLLRPEFPDDLGIADFGRLEEAVEIGYRAATAALAENKAKLAGLDAYAERKAS